MIDGLQATASSLSSLSDYYCTVTENLANASTTGYKRHCSAFEQALAKASASVGEAGQGGAIISRNGWDMSQGHLVQTGRPLDLALEGKGFFVVETPQGVLYTRGGVLNVSPTGQIVDHAGRVLAGTNGPITLPSTDSTSNVVVGRDGNVSVGGKQLGQLRIVEFKNTKELTGVGDNCFTAPDSAQPAAAGNTSVQQGCQEASNVNIVNELVELIKLTRAYESNLKTVQAQDERYRNLLRVATGF
jgi:flagellar basal-body rod protein FlgF